MGSDGGDNPRIWSRFLILMNGKIVTLFIEIGGKRRQKSLGLLGGSRNTGVKNFFSL